MKKERRKQGAIQCAVFVLMLCFAVNAAGAAGMEANGTQETPVIQHSQPGQDASLISLSLDDVEIAEVFSMLSHRQRINIILDRDVKGPISINLYDVTTEEAITAIAESAGYVVRRKYGGYIILSADNADGSARDTIIRTFKVQYTDPEKVQEILSNHLSKHGKITVLAERDLIVIEDNPLALARIVQLLAEIDKEPRQILIEAKIFEIKLNDDESWGLNWAKIFDKGDSTGSFEWAGSGSTGFTGYVATLNTGHLTSVLNLLSEKGRVRTLSTPKLLALENQEASVIIGQRQGYKVTTTINQVTTESVEFLESGVILTVTPSVDGQGRILMAIHPEVSTGTIQGGIPDKTTTEVTTMLLAADGQPIFIGGLIKNNIDYQRNGIPVLGDIPGLGLLFSDVVEKVGLTETVVLITPYLIKDAGTGIHGEEIDRLQDEIESVNERMRALPAKIKEPTP